MRMKVRNSAAHKIKFEGGYEAVPVVYPKDYDEVVDF